MSGPSGSDRSGAFASFGFGAIIGALGGLIGLALSLAGAQNVSVEPSSGRCEIEPLIWVPLLAVALLAGTI